MNQDHHNSNHFADNQAVYNKLTELAASLAQNQTQASIGGNELIVKKIDELNNNIHLLLVQSNKIYELLATGSVGSINSVSANSANSANRTSGATGASVTTGTTGVNSSNSSNTVNDRGHGGNETGSNNSLVALNDSNNIFSSSHADAAGVSNSVPVTNDIESNSYIGNLEDNTAPRLSLSKASSVKIIWIEYQYGLNNQPPLKEIFKNYNSKLLWARNKTIKRSVQRRKTIWRCIENAINNKKMLEDDVISLLEVHRLAPDGSKRPMMWLYKNIPQELQF
ncbi:hypothetical protein PACTADRAFT_49468 [Pachysolen tannophilus NRRL Y-2460]|uniref:Transcription activator GCR1-like domain-containing protein n=1 Tax=Pachysolen tannophilus NRRL Y-2460 TaxID=669874 RepID=A0A1E4TWC2_PACTA|nr:hypothetical protein PACTADRAFT_49468 [Pachysolen tannophilus NRRL Y-2460]